MLSDPTRGNCFVIMPFTVKEGDRTRYEDPNHWDEVYHGLIEPAAELANLECQRDDADTGSRHVVENILRKIDATDLVLCDLSSSNPNVFLELGWTLRADKPYVLIKDEVTSFSFDVSPQFTFQYSSRLQPLGLTKSVRELATAIRSTFEDGERRYSIVSKLGLTAAVIDAAQHGDQTSRMLVGILQKLDSLDSKSIFATGSPHRAGLQWSEWPTLLRRATALLEEVCFFVSNRDQTDWNDPVVRQGLSSLAVAHGAFKAAELQFSVLDENRVVLFHDRETMIGKNISYRLNDGSDMYDEVFARRSGAIAWEDRASNAPYDQFVMPYRFSVGIFALVESANIRVFVEVHQETRR